MPCLVLTDKLFSTEKQSFVSRLIVHIFDSCLSSLARLLEDNLHIIVDEFDHTSTTPHILFDLTDLSISPTKGNCSLDSIVVNHFKQFQPAIVVRNFKNQTFTSGQLSEIPRG